MLKPQLIAPPKKSDSRPERSRDVAVALELGHGQRRRTRRNPQVLARRRRGGVRGLPPQELGNSGGVPCPGRDEQRRPAV